MSKNINEPYEPYELVALALNINSELLNEDSALGETPKWDSLNHVVIIGELEKKYKIEIPDEDIEKYITMKAIVELCNSVK